MKSRNESIPRWRAHQPEEKVHERFHGAFTGGFSAGYFNTVGSKEGWAPSQFKSTRAQKAAQTQQNTQDFMDLEDLDDLEKSVTLRPVHQDPPETQEMDLLTRLLKPLIQVSGLYKMGYQIMEKMGWKQGHGIGPKITKKMAVNDFETQQYEIAPLEESMNTTDDLKPLRARACTGLGYNMNLTLADSPEAVGGMLRPVAEILGNPLKTKKRKLPLLAGYDELDEDEDVLLIRKKVLPRPPSKPKFVSTAKIATTLRKCSDGSLPPEGFVVSIRPLLVPKEVEKIRVPEDFNPGIQITKSDVSRTPKVDMKLTTSEQRGNLLDEPQLKTTVSNYISEGKIETDDENKSSLESYPTIPRSLALAALSHPSSPYPLDRAKNARYRSYLESQSGIQNNQKLPSLSEALEFQRVAMIFRPASGPIADRFTSASGKTDEPIVRDGNLSMAEEAAQQGNYGPLTFSIVNWRPERLLSKRFGVPYVGVESVVAEEVPADANTAEAWTPAQIQQSKDSSILEPEQAPVEPPKKAPKDLFTAVFGDDQDEDEEEI